MNNNRKDILMKIKDCLIKAEMPCWYINEDPDSDSDIYFDRDNVLYVKGVKTAFKSTDVERISYRNYETDGSFYKSYNENKINYIKIMFMDKSEIIFYDYGDIEFSPKDSTSCYNTNTSLDALRVGGYEFDTKLSNDQMIIREGVLEKYNGNEECVVIPEGVKEIGPNAFYEKKIKQVVLPKSLLVVGFNSFDQCRDLEDVKFNIGLKVIKDEAFYNCKKLSEITIPNTVEAIHKWAFAYSGIIKVTMERGVSIEEYEYFHSFKGTPYLESQEAELVL